MEMPTDPCRIPSLPSSPGEREGSEPEVQGCRGRAGAGHLSHGPSFPGFLTPPPTQSPPPPLPPRQRAGPGLVMCSLRVGQEQRAKGLLWKKTVHSLRMCELDKGLGYVYSPPSCLSLLSLPCGVGTSSLLSSFGKDEGRMESGPKMAWGARKKERASQNGADELT